VVATAKPDDVIRLGLTECEHDARKGDAQNYDSRFEPRFWLPFTV
jgi:hypothetical protein